MRVVKADGVMYYSDVEEVFDNLESAEKEMAAIKRTYETEYYEVEHNTVANVITIRHDETSEIIFRMFGERLR